MWAWAGWRIRKMRRLVDHVLCKLRFEAEWYQARGCQARFVGHPYFDELAQRTIDEPFVRGLKHGPGPLVTILPGSRTQEVNSNLHGFLKTAALIRNRVPDVRFAIASYNSKQAELARAMLSEHTFSASVFTGRTPELIEAADCCLACSGSVSLELMYHEKPAVIHYWIGRVPFFVQKFFRKVRFITLANLLATEDRYCDRGELYDPRIDRDKVPYPEYLTSQDKSEPMATHIVEWLTQSQEREEVVRRLRLVKDRCVSLGASDHAARYLLENVISPRVLAPHHLPSRAA
jgi:lipid-A-disaccharide synthase